MEATQKYKICNVHCDTTWCSSVPIASFLSDGFSWNSLLKSVGSTFYMIMSKKPLTNTFLPIAFHRNECYISVSLHRQNQIELVINRYRCLKNLMLHGSVIDKKFQSVILFKKFSLRKKRNDFGWIYNSSAGCGNILTLENFSLWYEYDEYYIFRHLSRYTVVSTLSCWPPSIH